MRQPKTVTIKATTEVQKMARKAIEIQDACNPKPCVTFFNETMDFFRDENDACELYGSDIGLQNPVTLSILDKIGELACIQRDIGFAFERCIDLAEGNDVEWTVQLLR